MKFPFNLRAESTYDAVGFGTNAVDYLIRVPAFPEYASKIELNDYSVSAGGEVASTMVGLSRLGARTAYAGRFGCEWEGEMGLMSLIDEGVNTEFAEVVDGALTQVAFIIVDETAGERTIIWKRDHKLSYSREDAPVAAAAKGRLLHMTVHDTAACISMATAARQDGVIVSVDVDNICDGINDLLPLVDVCIASSEFPEKLTGLSDRMTALRTIRERYGCGVTGVTLGAAGSIIFCNGEFIESEGYAVPGGCVDTTGAGDAFRTGLLYGVLGGHEVEDSAAMANAVAALKCRSSGARSGLPDKDELFPFLAGQPS
jgi:sugar/nucleoside kinase (ribokinase family)